MNEMLIASQAESVKAQTEHLKSREAIDSIDAIVRLWSLGAGCSDENWELAQGVITAALTTLKRRLSNE